MSRRRSLPGQSRFAIGASGARIAGAASLLRVGAALPDPPFEFMTADGPAGFDVALMQAIGRRIGREWTLVPYAGADFNGIFAGLGDAAYDCVASGATITPARERLADFCPPYVVSGQSLVLDQSRHPGVHGVADLKGLVIGVPNKGIRASPSLTSLSAKVALRGSEYAYDEIERALDDLATAGCDVFMKLAPLTQWYVRDRPNLKVVETGITQEYLGVCVRKGDMDLRRVISEAQAALMSEGKVAALIKQWLGAGARAPS